MVRNSEFNGLKRVGFIWGLLEVLLLLPILSMYLASTEGFVLRIVMMFTGNFRKFFVNVMIGKMFSSALMALGCGMVGPIINYVVQ